MRVGLALDWRWISVGVPLEFWWGPARCFSRHICGKVQLRGQFLLLLCRAPAAGERAVKFSLSQA
eukprot:9467427-Pyramimonas_sp.AAC.1